MFDSGGMTRRWQITELRAVGVVHLRREAVLRQRVGEYLAHLRPLVGIVDLVAANALADPRLGHTLGIA